MDPDIRSLGPDAKRALLGEILRRRASEPIRAALSSGQERLWRLLELEPDLPVYNLGFLYRLRGPLDVGSLERALGALTRRHEALRTAFGLIDGVPKQVIAPEVGARLERVDLASVPEADFPAEERRIAGEMARAGIDLTRPPLWRFALLERSGSDRALLIAAHHIISDRWSVGLLVQELAAEYRALRGGGPRSLAGPTTSYREATRALEAALTVEEHERQLAYWDGRFATGVCDLILPSDLRPAGEASYRGMRRSFELRSGLAAGLRAVAAAEGTTVYVVAVAALAANLYRETGQVDLVFTTPVSGRHHAATRGVIGYFNNLLPIRLAVVPRSGFRDLIRSAASAIKGAFEHQDVPYQRIAERPGVNRVRLGRCFIAVQNTTSLDLVLPGVESDYEDVPTDTANFDLAVVLEEQGDSYRGWVDAKADLWSAAALEGFLGGLLASMEALVAAPDLPLEELWPGAPAGVPPSAPDRDRSTPDGSRVGPAVAGPPERARNELERRMIGIWEEEMGLHPLAPDSHFFELGGHSLLAARIFDRTGRVIGREIPLAALLRAPTIRRLCDLILAEGDAPCWAALVPIRPRGDRAPLFCVHGGGGGVLSYTRIAEHIGADRPLWGLQAPRREGDPRPRRVEEMAGDYLQAILSVQPRGPFHLCGHSFGGLVAFEIARQLAGRGQEMGLLVVIDCPGPDARITWVDRLRWFTYSLAQLDRRQKVPYILERVKYRVRKNPRLYRALAKGGRLVGIHLDPRKTEYRLKTMSETMTAMELYRPGPYPGRLTLFRARGGDAAINSEPRGGWGRTALGGVDVHDFPCDHMEIFEEPHCRAVGAALRDCLARGEAATGRAIVAGGDLEAKAVPSR